MLWGKVEFFAETRLDTEKRMAHLSKTHAFLGERTNVIHCFSWKKFSDWVNTWVISVYTTGCVHQLVVGRVNIWVVSGCTQRASDHRGDCFAVADWCAQFQTGQTFPPGFCSRNGGSPHIPSTGVPHGACS